MMIIDAVGAARFLGAVFTCNVGPLTIGSEGKFHGHAWHTTHPEGHCVHSLIIDFLLLDIDQVVLYNFKQLR